MAGVSVTTVSRVINDRDGVSAKTRKKIMDIITTSDFKPRISRTMSDTVGVFIRHNGYNPLNSPYVHKVLDGIYDIIFRYGYNIMILSMDRIARDEDGFRSFCLNHNISAGIFSVITISDSFVMNYENVIPLVTVGIKFNSKKIMSVRANNKSGTYEAVKYLAGLGHKNIAFFVPNLNHQDYQDRHEGYTKAMADLGMVVNPHFDINFYNSETDLSLIIDALFDSNYDNPTAAIVCDDQEALKVVRILKAKGLEVPDDLSIIGFDDYDFSQYFTPPLTTVRQPVFELGQEAAKMIVNKLNNNIAEDEFHDLTLDTKLITRKTVKPADE